MLSAARSASSLAGVSASSASSACAPSASFRARKRALRQRIDAVLRARSPDAVSAESATACAALCAPPWLLPGGPGAIAAYLSMPHELQTGALLAAAEAAGRSLYVPRVTGAGPADMQMLHLAGALEAAVLPRDAWGVPTPGPHYALGAATGTPRRAWPDMPQGVEALTLVLVPGVAFDVEGGRLGHGRGYYDAFLCRLLAHWREVGQARGLPRPLLVGLCFDALVVPPGDIPLEPHDVRVDVIVSPALGAVRCRGEELKRAPP